LEPNSEKPSHANPFIKFLVLFFFSTIPIEKNHLKKSPYWKGTSFVYFKEENRVSIEALFSFVQIPRKLNLKKKPIR
jgi:hypothetical protein